MQPETKPVIRPAVRRLAFLVLMTAAVLTPSCTSTKVFLKIRQLHDADASKRRDAASDLGRLGDASAVEPLIASLGDADAGVKREAAIALGLLGDARAVEPMILAFPSDSWGQVDFAKGFSYLGMHTNIEAAIPALVKALRQQDETGQPEVASALGYAGAKALEPLRALLDDPSELVRLGGLRGIVSVAYTGGASIEAAVPRIVQLLHDGSNKVRAEASNALGRAKGAEVAGQLIEAAAEPDENVREAIAMALMSHREAIDALIAATRDANVHRRMGVARALESIDSVDQLGEAGKKARAALDAALANEEIAVVAGGREYYIRQGVGERALLAALDQYGSRLLGQDYLNCGNKVLEEAVKAWAPRHGFEVTHLSQKAGTSRWGKR